MGQREIKPLSKEEEVAICKKCGGFCCKYYCMNPGETDANMEFHLFRGREVIKYGVVEALLIPDKCPHSNDALNCCNQYENPKYPTICKEFPKKYRPFWNLKCKLMRVRYARGLIPKDTVGFAKLQKECGFEKSVFKFFK